MIFYLFRKDMMRGNGPEMAQNRAGEKLEQIPAERHRRADRHKETANRAIPEWMSVKELPKPFYDGRFSEVVRVTDGLHEAYAVYDADYHMWDIIGDEESAKSIHNISEWKHVNWVKGY